MARKYGFKKNRERYFDYNLLAVVIFLVCFGLIMLYSASSYAAQLQYGDGMYWFRKQGLISLASLAVMLFIANIDYHIWIKLAFFGYIVSLIMVLLVLTPLGIEAKGATRWIGRGNIRLQPAEVVKIAIILFIPYLIVKIGSGVKKIKGSLLIMGVGVLAALLLYVLTENLSSAIIVIGITAILLFIVHPRTIPFVGLGILGFGGIVFGINYLKQHIDFSAYIDDSTPFRIKRILAWLDPETHANDWAYQTMQGLYAIGNGGFFGKGLGNSAQKFYIPEVQNDMIFSIICEELGIFGALLVTLLFILLLYRLLFIARNAPDLYGSLLVTGIFSHIAIQVVLNIAVVINLIPTTGISLPFISYGGTSILFLMAEMGLALAVSKQIRFKD